jgi:hypothetical protein
VALGTSCVAERDTGTAWGRAPPRPAVSWAGLLLLVAVAVGLLG